MSKPSPRRKPTTEQQAAARRSFLAGLTRDLFLFIVGLLLIVNEAVLRSGPPRESLLVLYGGMVGLPAILRADLFRKKNGA